MQAVATWRKGHEILLEDGRAHSVLVDLTPEEGGTSSGTTPLELSLLALAGSLASTFLSLARKKHLDCSGLTVALEEDAPSGNLSGIRGTVRLRTRAEHAEVDAILRASLEACPVGRIFHEAHVPLNVTVVVASAVRPS